MRKTGHIHSKTAIIGSRAAGDYLEVLKDGTLKYRGNATVFQDMIGDIFGKRLLSTVGKVDYDYENNCIDFSSGGSITNANDRVGTNIEINHEMMVGDGIIFYPHNHWFQEVISHLPDVLDTTAYEITVRWRLIRNGHGVNLTTPDWNTLTITNGTDSVFDATNAGGKEYIGQITRTNAPITIDCNISDTFQIQMARTDALGGVMKMFFFDIHGSIDGSGSDEEISKTA